MLSHKTENNLTIAYLIFMVIAAAAALIGGVFVGMDNYTIGAPLMSSGIGGLVLCALICAPIAITMALRTPPKRIIVPAQPEYQI
jgi:hypothetical protein